MESGIFNLLSRRRESQMIDRIVEEAAETVKPADRAGFTVAWFPGHRHSNCSIERFASEVMSLAGKEPGGPATAAAG